MANGEVRGFFTGPGTLTPAVEECARINDWLGRGAVAGVALAFRGAQELCGGWNAHTCTTPWRCVQLSHDQTISYTRVRVRNNIQTFRVGFVNIFIMF